MAKASTLLEGFQTGSLREAVSRLENRLIGIAKTEAPDRIGQLGVSMELMLAALLIKRQASQINEIVHAIGILLALTLISEDGEIIEDLSLAAGNTGKDFDLKTTKRIPEFSPGRPLRYRLSSAAMTLSKAFFLSLGLKWSDTRHI